MKEIKVMYHDKDMPKLKNIGGVNHSVAIDLYTAEDIVISAGEFAMISLGVSIKLPAEHKGDLRPRSSMFKKFGLIQTNSKGLIDETYCGAGDIWKLPVFMPMTQSDIKNAVVDMFWNIVSTEEERNEETREIIEGILTKDLKFRSVTIPRHTRLCQMEIMPRMEAMKVVETDLTGEDNRGGFGEGTDGLK